jgi:hypothetical protein
MLVQWMIFGRWPVFEIGCHDEIRRAKSTNYA